MNISPSGSYWSEQYFSSTGTVIQSSWNGVLVEKSSHDRILICPHCGATYFFNPVSNQALIRLVCESCGSALEFK